MTMTSRYHRALGPHGFHRVHYTEWGDPRSPKALICVHGLTRTGGDFDFLAAALEQDYRVICPDVVGRGKATGCPTKPIIPTRFMLTIWPCCWRASTPNGLISSARRWVD